MQIKRSWLRNRYKITRSKLFPKTLKKLGILKAKVQVILKQILNSTINCIVTTTNYNIQRAEQVPVTGISAKGSRNTKDEK